MSQPGGRQAISYPAEPAVAAPAKAGRRKGRWKRRLSVLVIALVALVVGAFAWVDSTLQRVDYQPNEGIAGTAGSNWLIVGSDSRQGLTPEDEQRLGTGGDIGAGRTDTIMLLHQPFFGEATLLSIPRDSYVNVPGVGMEKINAAFAQGGAPLLTETVEQATGLHIDHYAEIGFAGFAGLVDAVGGVTVCPPEGIEDPLANLFIGPGCQELDGAQALGYVRTRATPMGDLDRVQRQREFFSALVDKATSAGTLLNPIRIVRMVHALGTLVSVGDGDHAWNLARLAAGMLSGIKTTTVPVGGFMDTEVGNVVLWDEPQAQALFHELGAKN